MAQLATYSTLYPLLIPRLNGLDIPTALQALQEAGREFCRDTELWREDFDPFVAGEWQQDYKLTLPSAVTAEIQRVTYVKVNGTPWEPQQYDLFETNILRFAYGAAPHDLDEQCLVCAAAGSALPATWAAVTNGSVTFTVDEEEYEIASITFAGCTSMDDVARKIQDELRKSMEAEQVHVIWSDDNDRFIVWVNAGTLSYLTAGGSGTNIAGASYMNGLTGSASLGGRIEVGLVYRPDVTTDVIPDWLLDRWGEMLVAKAVWRLTSTPGRPWTDPNHAAEARQRYFHGMAFALREKAQAYKAVSGGCWA